MARGNRKAVVFEDACDRDRFARILTKAATRYGVEVLFECRMYTHYHLIVRTPRANLPMFQQYLNGGFAGYSNRRHGRIGHVFGDRYKPLLVDNELYLRVVLAYVAMNPVAGGLVAAPADWKCSSYRAAIGMEPVPTYLSLDWLDAMFPGQGRAESQKKFTEYVAAPTLADAEGWLFEAVAGPPSFTRDIRAHIGATLYLASVPRAYRALGQPPLNELIPRPCSKQERARAILRAHIVHGYTMSDIARSLGVHLNTVSRIVSGVRRRIVDG
jgi:putative transposase